MAGHVDDLSRMMAELQVDRERHQDREGEKNEHDDEDDEDEGYNPRRHVAGATNNRGVSSCVFEELGRHVSLAELFQVCITRMACISCHPFLYIIYS